MKVARWVVLWVDGMAAWKDVMRVYMKVALMVAKMVEGRAV